MDNFWEALYFVFSFTYMVGRTCAVSLYAASINDQSKKPKAILFSVPTESYGVEVNFTVVVQSFIISVDRLKYKKHDRQLLTFSSEHDIFFQIDM